MARLEVYQAARCFTNQENLKDDDSSDWLFWKYDEQLKEYIVDEERKSAPEGMRIPGIRVLKKPENRANLLGIYRLRKGYDIDPIELANIEGNSHSSKAKHANELRRFLLNEDKLSKEAWEMRYLDIFGNIYRDGSGDLDITQDLGNDEALRDNYDKLCLMDGMNVVGEMLSEIAKDGSPEAKRIAREMLNEKKTFMPMFIVLLRRQGRDLNCTTEGTRASIKDTAPYKFLWQGMRIIYIQTSSSRSSMSSIRV